MGRAEETKGGTPFPCQARADLIHFPTQELILGHSEIRSVTPGETKDIYQEMSTLLARLIPQL